MFHFPFQSLLLKTFHKLLIKLFGHHFLQTIQINQRNKFSLSNKKLTCHSMFAWKFIFWVCNISKTTTKEIVLWVFRNNGGNHGTICRSSFTFTISRRINKIYPRKSRPSTSFLYWGFSFKLNLLTNWQIFSENEFLVSFLPAFFHTMGIQEDEKCFFSHYFFSLPVNFYKEHAILCCQIKLSTFTCLKCQKVSLFFKAFLFFPKSLLVPLILSPLDPFSIILGIFFKK